jgi:hypothetical protein
MTCFWKRKYSGYSFFYPYFPNVSEAQILHRVPLVIGDCGSTVIKVLRYESEGRIVHFQIYQARDRQMTDFINFIRMHKRNLYTRAKRSNVVANYLRIIEEN